MDNKTPPTKLPSAENSEDKEDEDTSTTDEEEECENEVPESEVVENVFLDEIIFRLMTAKFPQAQSPGIKKSGEAAPIIQVQISSDEIIQLCDLAIQSFASQKALIRFEKKDLPLVIVGDLHGQFRDLRSILTRCGPPNKQSYLFLGDYVDRGVQGIEVATLLLALKCKYPSKVFMLRGNHEDGNTCMSYGFYDECLERFLLDEGGGDRIWLKFLSVFNWLPLAAIIDSTILAMHGGISPHLHSLDDIDRIPRPAIVPPYGLLCDLVWSDPDDRHDGWALSPRGISFTFSSSIVESMCHKLGVELIVRAHQLTSEMIRSGHKFFANGRLVTIFSAPNYLNMKNDACVMKISKKLHCRFLIFRTMRKAMRTRSLAHRQRKS
uniref:Serine/threonine-protein phosphatase n=1 Tax=Panagrolaimus sp. ES5 TaxID=591445 RepID=A0AC34F7H2_9BILA